MKFFWKELQEGPEESSNSFAIKYLVKLRWILQDLFLLGSLRSGKLLFHLVVMLLLYASVIFRINFFSPLDSVNTSLLRKISFKHPNQINSLILLVAAAKQHEKHGKHPGFPKPIMTCPDHFDWDSVKDMCVRLVIKNPKVRCPHGRLNKDTCLDFYEPDKISCPPGYVDQGSRCANSEITQRRLVCKPDEQPIGNLCKKVFAKEVGYVCEKGNLDDENRCLHISVSPQRFTCPLGFVQQSIDECIKVTYFPCDVELNKKKEFPPPFKKPSKKSSNESSKSSKKSSKESSKESPKLPIAIPLVAPSIIKACWDKQIVPIMPECPFDSANNGTHCIIKRYFPKTPKCSGWLQNGRCMVEILSDAIWTCPLGYENGFSLPSGREGLHSEIPSVTTKKSKINPNYAPRLLAGSRQRMFPQRPNIVVLPAYETHVVQYEPGLSRRDPGEIKLKTNLKKRKTHAKDELLQAKILEDPGYCYREKYSGYYMECRHGYEPNTETRMCMGTFDPIRICDKGFMTQPDGCVKYEYVNPTEVYPSSMMNCSGIRCFTNTMDSIDDYGWKKHPQEQIEISHNKTM